MWLTLLDCYQNELVLSFVTPNIMRSFNKIGAKLQPQERASTNTHTYTHTEKLILLSVPCMHGNRTDNNFDLKNLLARENIPFHHEVRMI